eukprot:12964091-Alexandrium_andersonii.AAC.1
MGARSASPSTSTAVPRPRLASAARRAGTSAAGRAAGRSIRSATAPPSRGPPRGGTLGCRMPPRTALRAPGRLWRRRPARRQPRPRRRSPLLAQAPMWLLRQGARRRRSARRPL